MNYWPLRYSNKAVLYSFIVTLGISLAFLRFFMPAGLMITGLTIIILFFYGLKYFSFNLRFATVYSFEKKLFFYSLFFRFLFVLYLYILTKILDPNSFPFELGAADSGTYQIAALKLSNTPIRDYFNVLNELMKSKSDFGFPIFQSLIYKLFGQYTLPVRLINCLLGSFTVLYLSRTARYLLTENHARLTGVIAMIFPSLLWFGAIQIKETIMIFLIISVFYHSIKMNSEHRIYIKSMVIIVLFSFFLFYFRTFLAVLVIMSVLAYYAFSAIRKLNFRKILTVLFIFFSTVFLINNSSIFNDINEVYREGKNSDLLRSNLQYKAGLVGNISYKQAAVTPFVFALAILTPFPSFLNTESRQVPIIAHFQNEMVRNLLYYFAILGLVILMLKDFRKSSILILFEFGYLWVISSAGTSFIDRFHLILVPFMIITMSVGMINARSKWIKGWNWYLVFILIAQISWVIFKINIRGI